MRAILGLLIAALLFLQTSVARPTPDDNDRLIEGGSSAAQAIEPQQNDTAGTLHARAPAIPAWRFYVNGDHNYHQQQWNALAPNGWRMISLSVYGSPVRYAAVWVQRPGPAHAAIHGASAAAYQKWFDDWSAKGFVSTIVAVTGPAENPTYAGVMEDVRVPSWWQRCGMARAEFDAQIAQRRAQSMVLRSFREYGGAGNRRYCALWHGTGGFEKHNAWPSLSYADYQLRFNAETQKRYWRPAYVAVSEDHLVTSLFVDTSIGPVVARHGLTAAGLEAEYKTHMANWLYPIQIQGAGSGSNTRFAALFAQQDSPTPRQWTVNGPAVTGFKNNADAAARVDALMQGFMRANGVRQAQVAVGKGANRVLLERAYTWAEPDRHRTTPADRFLLASVSKMFVAGAIQHLYSVGRLTPTTRVYPLLGYNAPADPRSSDITVEHLVHHMAGYDRSLASSPDPVLIMRDIARARGGTQPASMRDVVDYVVARPLDFTPGSKSAYSNYGYMLLAYLVERVSGIGYVEYLRRNVLNGLDVAPYATAAAAHVSDPVFQETMWLGPDAANPQSNLLVPGVYGGDGIYKESAFGPSAMSCSASTLVRYISTHAARFTGPRTPGSWHDGVMAGSRTLDASRADGVDWAIVLNTADFPSDANWNDLIANFNKYWDTNPVA